MYLFYTYIFISQRCWHVFGTLIKLSLSPTFHNVIGTLWECFVGHFEKYFYLFIQSSHFVRGICLPEVEHRISQWNGVSITFYSVNLFSKARPDNMIHADFTILQKGCHNIVNIITLSYMYETVAIMLWRCFLTTFAATLWQHSCQLSWNMLQQDNPKRCGNVASTIYYYC